MNMCQSHTYQRTYKCNIDKYNTKICNSRRTYNFLRHIHYFGNFIYDLSIQKQLQDRKKL